jgi:hypothetical protein
MLSAHPPVPLSQITITHADPSSSPAGGGGIADRRPSVSRLTLHTATGRQLHVEDHGLPSPRTLSPLATPTGGGAAGAGRTASGRATPEKSDGEDAADRIKGRDYAVGGDAFESAVRERVSWFGFGCFGGSVCGGSFCDAGGREFRGDGWLRGWSLFLPRRGVPVGQRVTLSG